MKNLVRFDWAIKRLLRNKANFVILEGFLSELLGEDIKIESILESESNQDYKNDKFNKVDLLVKNSKGELVIIEIQNNREYDYLLRILFGTSKLLIDNMETGMSYSEIKKIISVSIVYFNLGQGEDYVYHGTTNFVGLHKNDILKLSKDEEILYKTESISKIYPEYYIIKVNQFDDVAKSTLDEWIYFLKKEEIKDEFKAKGLKEAKNKLDVLKLSEHERKEYERFIEQVRYENSLIVSNYEVGELKGKEEKSIEIAKNLLKAGIDINIIEQSTGLSKEEIEKLK
ncbi:MAG TPA: Rpn family recombination-promoting nuclease/putative transposase [Bacteroidales bacterium]|nr:Rpn family recombination-promoting nuclease/putative transposase [Bacteroidales bacterium]